MALISSWGRNLEQLSFYKTVPVITPTTSTRRGSPFLVTGSPHKMKVVEADGKINGPNPSTSGMARAAKPGTKRKLQMGKTEAANKRRAPQPKTARSRKRTSSKKKDLETDSSNESDIPYVSTDDEDSDEDVDCNMCGKPFSSDTKGEVWLQCSRCFNWCHEVCTSVPKKRNFSCDFCMDQ